MSEEDTMSGAEQLRHPTPKLNGGSCRLCRGDRKLRTYSVGVLILFSDQMAPEISEILKPIRVFEDSAISIRAFTDNSI